MIVRTEDFVARRPAWVDDPEIPPGLKDTLCEMGMAELMNRVECLEIVDECFECGEKLTTPYIYWNGGTGTLSLHPICAAKLVLGLVQDACTLATGQRPRTERDAATWLDLFAAKKEYGIEDEELPRVGQAPDAASEAG